MELRQYWRIVWRRWWLIVGLVAIVLVVTGLMFIVSAFIFVMIIGICSA